VRRGGFDEIDAFLFDNSFGTGALQPVDLRLLVSGCKCSSCCAVAFLFLDFEFVLTSLGKTSGTAWVPLLKVDGASGVMTPALAARRVCTILR
jgi:hypothetical protein